jgi:transcriptional regulator GlxA family with amidase domain
MSVCTGAFILASTGLLDGLSATTHHFFFDQFAQKFPNVTLVRGRRFVDNGKLITAGGLTSGVDAALHVVQRYYGPAVTQRVADYMEYQSSGWRT